MKHCINSLKLSTVTFQILLWLISNETLSLKVDDILDTEYFPGHNFLTGHSADKSIGLNDSISFDSVFSLLNYHRNMMKEYQCRNYLTSQIVSSLDNVTKEDRTGKAVEGRAKTDDLLKDAGSAQYKQWLERSNTLQDIFRQYENVAAADASVSKEHVAPPPMMGGDVTGYAMIGGYKPPDVVNDGYGTGTSYGVPEYSPPKEKGDKGVMVKELFQLALTALAFLAFGMFFINVIMCIIGNESSGTDISQQTMMMMMPSGAVLQAISKEEQHEQNGASRKKREAEQGFIQIELLNEMSSRVLKSIEAFSVLKHDKGLCLQRVICEGNNWSRNLSGLQRVWVPLWSLGMSWIGGNKFHNVPQKKSVLDHLRATIYGLGNGDCFKVYPGCENTKIKWRKKK